MNFTSDENNTGITTYEAGEACSFGITSVNYITSRTEQVTSGEGNTTIDKFSVTYDAANMRTDEPSAVYCIRNATSVVSYLKDANGTDLSYVGSGNMYRFSPSTVGEWTTIDVNGGDSVNVPGFYNQESGTVELDLQDGKYTKKIQGTFVDMCAAVDSSVSPPAGDDSDASSASPTTSVYSPKSTCESVGITNVDECVATCDKYFDGLKSEAFGPTVDGKPQDPYYCMCKAVDDIANNDRYVCGATTDVYFTCAEVNVTDVSTCDDVCKQDTSTQGTTFSGGWNEEHSICQCLADVPNSGEFNYCGGPPPPPASGVLPTCSSMGFFFERECDNYCRDYLRIDYPQFQQFYNADIPGGGMKCLCSTGAGCEDEQVRSSGRKLGAWVSSLMMLTATVIMATVL